MMKCCNLVSCTVCPFSFTLAVLKLHVSQNLLPVSPKQQVETVAFLHLLTGRYDCCPESFPKMLGHFVKQIKQNVMIDPQTVLHEDIGGPGV